MRRSIIGSCLGIAATAAVVSIAMAWSDRAAAQARGAAQARVAAQEAAPRWTVQQSGVTARLRGVSVVSARVAWASGANGTIVRTIDGGETWQPRPVPDAAALDFRDIDAVDERTAYALSIGPGEASRIFKTTDGGATWQTQHVNRDPKAFFDAMAFATPERGIVISDAVDGAHVVLQTVDGGRTWTRVPAAALPAALPNEGAFAASGTNIATVGRDRAWIATNAPGVEATAPAVSATPAAPAAPATPAARVAPASPAQADGQQTTSAPATPGESHVLRTTDGGRTWALARTPLAAGPSAGIFSIAFRDATHGVIVGGDYRQEREAAENVAFTADGGVTWTLVREPTAPSRNSDAVNERGVSGFRSAVVHVPRAGRAGSGAGAGAAAGAPTSRTFIAVGPSGADLSTDDGRTWRPIAPDRPVGGHAFGIAPDGSRGWAVGERGQIARLDLR